LEFLISFYTPITPITIYARLHIFILFNYFQLWRSYAIL